MVQTSKPTLPLAVQLYTVRDLVQTDFAAVLQQIAKIGYAGVELAGYGNLREPVAVKKAIRDAGLKTAGSHAGIEVLEAELDRVLDENEVLGNRTIVCPWMPEQRRQDAEGWLECARVLNRIGEACSKRGFTFCYHHHSFEFARFKLRATGAEKTGMDIVWENTDPKFVKAEIDTYWVEHGGEDPAAYIRNLGSRVQLVHLKDMADGADRRFAPVGSGILDFKGIIAASSKAGVKWGVVEQDDCYATPPLEALRLSFENLQKIMA
jgi:sugar phosphate isomerase/epimerase